MKKIEIFQELIQKFQDQNIIDLHTFEIDILKAKKQYDKNDEYDVFALEDKIESIYSKHTKKIKSLGYAKDGMKYISDIYPKLDDNKLNLEKFQITQFQMLNFLVDTMGKIEQKYLDIPSAIMLGHSLDETIFIPRQDMMPRVLDKRLDTLHYNSDQVIIEIAATTLFETYQTWLNIFALREDTYSLIMDVENSIIKVDKNKLLRAEENFTKIFQAIRKRKIEHRGKIDKNIRLNKRIDTLQNSLTRLKYSLNRSERYENALKIIDENTPLEILKTLEKYDYNYIDYEHSGYDLFERLIEFVIELHDNERRTEQSKSYRKMGNALKKLEESLSDFDTFDFNKDGRFLAIDNFMNIGKNQVLGYVAVVFERYFDIDREKTRGLLNFVFSKAEEKINKEKNTNQGKNYYQDFLFEDDHTSIEIMVPQCFFRNSDWDVNY